MDGKRWSGISARSIGMIKRAGWFFSGMAVLGVCLVFRAYAPAEHAAAKPPTGRVTKASATAPRSNRADAASAGGAAIAPKKNPISAIVNNEPISRDDLGRECLLHYGTEVLESLVNRSLILTSCQRRNIEITDKQITEEIDRMAQKFQISKDQWLKTLEKERGIKPARYANDIIWPTLALRELAKHDMTVSQQELDEGYESEFGPAVKVRLIAIENSEKARQVHAQAVAKPEEFPALAKKWSQNPNSASAYGLIQPIRHHVGDPQLEQAAFALKKGEISKIVKIGEMNVFIKCEEHLPPPKGVDRAKYDPLLTDAIKDRKLRKAASEVFRDLQNEAVVENIYNDPAKSKQMPGVAAIVNGQQISIRELSEECVERHGTDVLEGTVNRKLLDQALKRRNLKVGDKDLDEEIGRAAVSMGKVKSNGQPDVEAWLEYITKGENISREVYLRDEVWPSAALKRLVGDDVKITQEDLQRGYEANYGPKVRCRAIVLNNQRRAQEVWEKVRENMNSKTFGDLAEQYSIEAGSRSLRGEVPPIQKHGGQKLMEDEAFSLSAENPLSGIIQVGGTYVMLFYEGRTKPINTSFDEVKELLYRDIHEKKQRIAMARTFDKLKEEAHVDNFLTGQIKVPKKEELNEAVEPGVKMPRVMRR